MKYSLSSVVTISLNPEKSNEIISSTQTHPLPLHILFYPNANPFISLEFIIYSIPDFDNSLIFTIILPQRGKMSIELFKPIISSRGVIPRNSKDCFWIGPAKPACCKTTTQNRRYGLIFSTCSGRIRRIPKRSSGLE